MWEENPHCHWCGIKTELVLKSGGSFPNHAATIDHIYSRFHPNRRKPNCNNESRYVLSCWKCNNDRGRDEYLENQKLEISDELMTRVKNYLVVGTEFINLDDLKRNTKPIK